MTHPSVNSIVERLRNGEPCLESNLHRCRSMTAKAGCVCAESADIISDLQAERYTLIADLADMKARALAAESSLSRIKEEMADLRAVEKAARKYFNGYVQDEAAERDCCVSDDQHQDAIRLMDALSAIRSLGSTGGGEP